MSIDTDAFTVTARDRAYFMQGFQLARTLAAMVAEPPHGAEPFDAVTLRRALAAEIRGIGPPEKIAPEIADGQ